MPTIVIHWGPTNRYCKELEGRCDALNLAGSILAWVDSGFDVVDPTTGEATTRVHTYGPQWDVLPSGFQGVQFGATGQAQGAAQLLRRHGAARMGMVPGWASGCTVAVVCVAAVLAAAALGG